MGTLRVILSNFDKLPVTLPTVQVPLTRKSQRYLRWLSTDVQHWRGSAIAIVSHAIDLHSSVFFIVASHDGP